MPAEIETMAWTAEEPWHGLGVRVGSDTNPDEMLRAAGLDWTVSKRPVYTTDRAGAPIPVPGRVALVRDTDDRVLSEVGEDWHPLQNRDAFDFFASFVAKGGATMETAGSLRGGRMVWGLARLPADFRLAGGDEVRGYLLLASPHEGGRTIQARVTTVRVVCQNTLSLAMSGSAKFSARFAHHRAFDPTEAVEAIGIASEEIVAFSKTARTLKKLKLTDREVLEVLAPIYQPDDPALLEVGESAAHPALRSVLDSYRMAPGADVGTGWGVLNAVTYHADHRAGRRDAKTGQYDTDARLFSAWLGTEATRKQATLDSLLALV